MLQESGARWRVSLALALGLGLRVASPCFAQAPPAAESELTPGAVALFAETAARPGTQQLLTLALASTNPEVRAVAARVARVSGSVGQTPALERALAAEPNGSTRLEISRALEGLQGARPRAESPSALDVTAAPAAPANPRVRIWPWVTPHLGRDLLRVTGCKLPKEAPFIVAQVHYRPNGSIAHGGIEGDLLSDACKRVARVLTMMTLASPGRAIEPGVKEVVVMAFDDDFLDCVEQGASIPDSPKWPREGVRVASGTITAPRKIRNVNPVYPQGAQERRVQGVVVLEATITPQGCVSQLEVLRSVDPQLDFAALRAVMEWRYTPTLLEGAPVPVIMTVTVNFTLETR